MAECPTCGAEISFDSKSCPDCGEIFGTDEDEEYILPEDTNLEENNSGSYNPPFSNMTLICSDCGAEFDSEDTRCRICGHPNPNYTNTEPPPQDSENNLGGNVEYSNPPTNPTERCGICGAEINITDSECTECGYVFGDNGGSI